MASADENTDGHWPIASADRESDWMKEQVEVSRNKPRGKKVYMIR